MQSRTVGAPAPDAVAPDRRGRIARDEQVLEGADRYGERRLAPVEVWVFAVEAQRPLVGGALAVGQGVARDLHQVDGGGPGGGQSLAHRVGAVHGAPMAWEQ